MLLYVLCVAASAFCLFLIQPLMAKEILPVFGGAASVWTVCLVFYQTILLAGYLYAHALASKLSLRGQVIVHLSVTLLGTAALLHDATPAAGALDPSVAIVLLLAQAVGLPYFVLSTTSPLLQSWYAARYPDGRAYRLFAWSNLACVAALLAFPLVFERVLPLSTTLRTWKIGFAVTAALLCVLALTLLRGGKGATTHREAEAGPSPSKREALAWLGYSLLGSVLLLAVTNHVCQVVAPFPFLWVAPLLLYLMTFVVCFEWERISTRITPAAGLWGLLAMAAAATVIPPSRITDPGMFLWLGGMFGTCLYFHGELASRKPPARNLTLFYIVMAAGGALGSFLVAFVAPVIFPSYWELPLVMLAAAALLFQRADVSGNIAYYTRSAMIVVTVPVALALIFNPVTDSVDTGRNFYGILRVLDGDDGGRGVRVMVHGPVLHGKQFLDPALRTTATTYFSRISGAGQILDQLPSPRKVGVVGLGAGTLATYGRQGDEFVFYEINPMVERMARQHFTFIGDCAAKVDVRTGDARLLLERESPQNYDVLAVDAFSGDAIPVHLLTREAFEQYRRHIKPGGVILLHISNYNLELEPVVESAAAAVGLSSVRIDSGGDERIAAATASWMVVGTREALALKVPSRVPVQRQPDSRYRWTDDFSSLLSVLRH